MCCAGKDPPLPFADPWEGCFHRIFAGWSRWISEKLTTHSSSAHMNHATTCGWVFTSIGSASYGGFKVYSRVYSMICFALWTDPLIGKLTLKFSFKWYQILCYLTTRSTREIAWKMQFESKLRSTFWPTCATQDLPLQRVYGACEGCIFLRQWQAFWQSSWTLFPVRFDAVSI